MRAGRFLQGLLATGAIGLAGLTVSCSGSAPEQAVPESLAATDEVVIDWFVGLGTGTERNQIAAQNDVVDAFNESQDEITLRLEVVDQRLAFDLLSERIADGDAPDLVGPMGIRGANTFDGAFLDLSGFLNEEILSAYDPEQIEVWTNDGRVEALPFGVFPSMIFYNRDLFDRAGLAYPPAEFGGTYEGEPWDIDAFNELATKLTLDANGNSADSPHFEEDLAVQWGFSHQWLDDPRSHGAFFGPGSLVGDDGSAQIPENWLAEWRWLHESIWETRTVPSPSQRGTDLLQNGNLIASGRVAMAFTHLWYAGSANDDAGNPVDFWDLAATPSYNGQITSKLHADTFRIMDQSDSPAEAFEALSYLLDEGAAELLQAYGSFPARVELRDDFLAGLGERHPSVQNWATIADALQYPDIPSHEGPLPAVEESQAVLDAFGHELLNDPELDVEARAATLKAELDAIFTGDR